MPLYIYSCYAIANSLLDLLAIIKDNVLKHKDCDSRIHIELCSCIYIYIYIEKCWLNQVPETNCGIDWDAEGLRGVSGICIILSPLTCSETEFMPGCSPTRGCNANDSSVCYSIR